MPPRQVQAAASLTHSAEDYEDQHVHAVYDQIATHFSETRYKPWPIIASFLSTIPSDWLGLDSGCGNGKYLPLAFGRMIGLDRSRRLLEFARLAGGEHKDVVQSDVLDSIWRIGIFDYCISIATIHHLATHQRRRESVSRLLQSVSAHHGRILVYVWSVEQDTLSKREVTEQVGQDVFVPWVTQQQNQAVLNRYYHLFRQGELEQLVTEAATELGLVIGNEQQHAIGVEIIRQGWERSNYYIELRRWNTQL